MMKSLLLFVFLFVLLAYPAMVNAQTLTPQDARATLTVARAQATAASDLATANAPTSTSPATWTPMPPTATTTPTQASRGRTIYDDWPLLFLLGIGALALVIVLSRLIDGKTITLPGWGRGRDDR